MSKKAIKNSKVTSGPKTALLQLQKSHYGAANPFTLRIEGPMGIFEMEIPALQFALLMQNEVIEVSAHDVGANTDFKVGDHVATNQLSPVMYLGTISRLTRTGAMIASSDPDVDGEEYVFEELVQHKRTAKEKRRKFF